MQKQKVEKLVTENSAQEKTSGLMKYLTKKQILLNGHTHVAMCKEYDNFISDLLMLLSEPNVDQVFIDAKIGEESEYDTSATYEPVIIRKIEDYEVEKIIS